MATAATTKNLSQSAAKQKVANNLTPTKKRPGGIILKMDRMTKQTPKSPQGK